MADRIYLATLEKQEEILSHFPIDSGTDFFAGTNVYLESASSSPISVTGKGLVMIIRNSDSGGEVLNLIVDGTTVTLPAIPASELLNVFIPFNSSLEASLSRRHQFFILLF